MSMVVFTKDTKIKSADVNANFSGLADGSLLTTGAVPWTILAGTASSSFAFTWKGESADPAIGNGAVGAQYFQAGKLVRYWGIINIGSTSTFGTGEWYVNLPVSAKSNTNIAYTGSCWIKDSGTGYYSAVCHIASSELTKLKFFSNTGASAVATAVPISWAAGDALHWMIEYEAA